MGFFSDLWTLIVGPPHAETAHDAIPWVCLLAFLYNLEHGIIPAALPQVEAEYGPNAIAEALLQVVSVLGILTGIAFDHATKLKMSRFNLMVSTLLITVCCFGTWLVPFEGTGELSWWLHFWRFVTGAAASYAIVMVPQWLDVRLLRADRESATATYLSYGLFGTVCGYLLVLTVPAIRTFLAWCASQTEPWREAIREEPGWDERMDWLEERAVRVFGCEDFRQAFLYAGIICVLTLLRFLHNVPSDLVGLETGPPQAATRAPDEDRLRFPFSRPSVEMVSYHSIGLETDGRSDPGRSDPGHYLARGTSSLDTAWLSELFKFTVFRWTILAIGSLMTIANAVTFWLFTHFKQGHHTSDQVAILCTAVVLVGGSALGMYYPPRRILRDEPTEAGGSQFNSPLFKGFTLCTGMASLCGTTVCIVKDTTTTTVLFAMAIYFGASVLPLAQTTFGYSVKPELKSNAMTLYQFVYQATWIVGPLLPVMMGRMIGGSASELGLRSTCLLNWFAFFCFWRATRFQEQQERFHHDGISTAAGLTAKDAYPATASAIM